MELLELRRPYGESPVQKPPPQLVLQAITPLTQVTAVSKFGRAAVWERDESQTIQTSCPVILCYDLLPAQCFL